MGPLPFDDPSNLGMVGRGISLESRHSSFKSAFKVMACFVNSFAIIGRMRRISEEIFNISITRRKDARGIVEWELVSSQILRR